jgi:ABC-type long-subunit fatty acid transport system fused permease/ATPase subunit
MHYFSTIPTIVIVGAVLFYLLSHFLYRWRPEWTKPFISERSEEWSDLPVEPIKQRVGWVISLFLITLVGLAAEVVKKITNGLEVATIALLVSWVR